MPKDLRGENVHINKTLRFIMKRFALITHLLLVLVLFGCSSGGGSGESDQQGKPRVIVSSDIGGTDPDDFQSMIHYLMYADRFRTEGLVSSAYGPGRKEHILEMIDLYEQDLPKLREHAAFPEADELSALVKQGATEMAPARGWSTPTEGSRWIVERAHEVDKAPLWVLVWGGLEDVAQALHDDPGIAGKIRVYWIGGPNKKWSRNAYLYIASNFPDLWMIEANSTYRGWFIGEAVDPGFTNKGFYERHIRGRGAMGNDFGNYYDGEIKMGDSPSVGYLLSGDSDDPSGESWGGSFEPLPYSAVRRFGRHTTQADTIPVYGLVEWSFQSEDPPADEKEQEIWMEIDRQRIDGFYDGQGVFTVRFVPKGTGSWSYTVNSSSGELNGSTGGFTSVNPWPGPPNGENLQMNTWWSDRQDDDLFIGQYQGAETVAKWRGQYLADWAERWSWLED